MTPNQMLTEKIAALVPTAKVQLNRLGISLDLDGNKPMLTDEQVNELEAIGMNIGLSRRTGWLALPQAADISELDPKLQAFLQNCQAEAQAERDTLPVGETTAEAWMREKAGIEPRKSTGQQKETDMKPIYMAHIDHTGTILCGHHHHTRTGAARCLPKLPRQGGYMSMSVVVAYNQAALDADHEYYAYLDSLDDRELQVEMEG